MDVDNLDPGVDFVEEIKRSVGSCDVLIAVIGKRWLISSDEHGKRRLDNPNDFVRIEIAIALKLGIGVIPVLVEGASIPEYGELPDDLKQLIWRNALGVTHHRFDGDFRRLVAAIERIFEKANAMRKQLERERLEAEPASVAYREGQRHFDERDYTKAKPLFEKASEAGDPLAMLTLGEMHFKGLGVVRNSDQALSWYRRAAVLGNVDAAKALAKLCTMGYGAPSYRWGLRSTRPGTSVL